MMSALERRGWAHRGESNGGRREWRSQRAYPGERTPDRKSLLAQASTAENAQASSENVSAHLMMRAAANVFGGRLTHARTPHFISLRAGAPTRAISLRAVAPEAARRVAGASIGAIAAARCAPKTALFSRAVRWVGHLAPLFGDPECRQPVRLRLRGSTLQGSHLFHPAFDEYILEIAPPGVLPRGALGRLRTGEITLGVRQRGVRPPDARPGSARAWR